MTTAHVVCQQETITITARQAAAEGVQQQRPKEASAKGGQIAEGGAAKCSLESF